jgi:hypothetical protein
MSWRRHPLPLAVVFVAFGLGAPANPAKPDGKVPPGQAKKQGAAKKSGRGALQSGRATRSQTIELPLTTQLPTLGSWLDDTQIVAPRSLSVGLAAGWCRSPSARSLDAPVSATLGLGRRVQASVGVPYYYAKDDTGISGHNLGDSYLGVKFQLRDADNNSFGVALAPTIEVLGPAAADDASSGAQRVYWLLPLSVEKSLERVQLYSTAGYFSRGALFVSAAVGITATQRCSFIMAVSHAYSTHAPSADSDLERSRTDGSFGVSLRVSTRLGLHASVGRTLSTLDDSGAKLAASIGATYTVAPRGSRH